MRAAAGVALLVGGMCRAQTTQPPAVIRREPVDTHVDWPFFGHGLDPTGGVHLGSPALVSAAVGAKYYLGDIMPGALFATVEPGLLAARYGAGYQLFDERLYGLGAAYRVVGLTGWSRRAGVVPGVHYTGREVAVTLIGAYSFRVGWYKGRDDGTDVTLRTFDVGIGF